MTQHLHTAAGTYRQFSEKYSALYKTARRKHSRISIARLLSVLGALACFYRYGQALQALAGMAGLGLVLLFVWLMKQHQKTGRALVRLETLVQINEEELAYLEKGALPFADGTAYAQEQHDYAADLDLFGSRSLYQHLNRTATQMGKDCLARGLLSRLSEDAIRERQEAVAEWSARPEDRQELYALARIASDNRDTYNRLLHWAQKPETPVPVFARILAWLLPAALIAALLLYAILQEELYKDIAIRLFPLNLLLFFFLLRRIRGAMFAADKANAMLLSYAAILRRIDSGTYASACLLRLQRQLRDTNAGERIQQLTKIYAGMEAVQNPFAAVFMNGLYLAHVHMLHKLSLWKNAYAVHIPDWLQVIGEMELLNSLANLHYNNPGFCFPELNRQERIAFRALGHPMIPPGKRVCNDISFESHRFMILTGSNMSGKSTFLRTLGINMVLAGMGSCICAAAADIHPLPVLVSMRQSDSLADSESYFFAEVKRLQYIMEQASRQTSFVLLDEILRGTNSDDKRSGTIGVIEKMLKKHAIGAIATHDLEVCQTATLYPDMLHNCCFEVEIVNNELVFDYKLRNGICRNKSATFLMKKMEII